LLHQVLYGGLGSLSRAGEDRLNLGAADHFAHSALRDGFYGAFRILNIEEELTDPGWLYLPQHREIDVHDVFVAGKHQALLRHVTRCGTATPNVIDHSHADIYLIDAQRLWREHGLYRIRQMVVQPRLYFAHFLSEAEHHAEFVRLNA